MYVAMFVTACTTLKAVFVTKMQSKSQNKEQKRRISANLTKKCATATKKNKSSYYLLHKKVLQMQDLFVKIMFRLIHICANSI